MLKWCVASTRVATAFLSIMAIVGVGDESLADEKNGEDEIDTEKGQATFLSETYEEDAKQDIINEWDSEIDEEETTLENPIAPPEHESLSNTSKTSTSSPTGQSPKTVTFKQNFELCEIKIFLAVKCDKCTFEFQSQEELDEHLEKAHKKRNG